MPQPPQFALSVCSSTQAPLHDVWPGPHVPVHPPLEHSWPGAHALPHLPQLFGSASVSTHLPLQLVCPVGQPHLPLAHAVPPAQPTPQPPQSPLSFCSSTHAAPDCESPGAHVLVH